MQRLHNVTFERADAQAHRFPQARFDLAINGGNGVWFDSRAWIVTARRH